MAGREILITGACGYIGSHISRLLSESGRTVIALDDLSTGFADALICDEKLFKGSCGDRELLTGVFKSHAIGSVIHLAAKSIVPESVANPELYYRENVLGTLNLASVAKAYGVKHFLFSSSASVYGSVGGLPVREDARTVPESPYGRSKFFSEHVLRDLCAVADDNEMKVCLLRYFNVAGADPKLRLGQRTKNATHVIKVAAQAALGLRPEFTIYGDNYETSDGTCIRDYIHVQDLAAAHSQCLSFLENGGDSQTFNCGYGKGFSVKEVLQAMGKVSKTNFPIKVGARRPGDVESVVADSNKILRMTSWRPEFADLETIVSHAFHWEKKLRDWDSR
jgi:UDP-glucose 4-epimerase